MTTATNIARHQQIEQRLDEEAGTEISMIKMEVKSTHCHNKSTNYKANKMPPSSSSLLQTYTDRRAGASNGQHKTPPEQEGPSNSTPTTTTTTSSQRRATRSSKLISRSKSYSCSHNMTTKHQIRRQYYCMRPYQSQLVFLLALSIVSLTIVMEHLPGSDRNNKISGNNNGAPFLRVQALQINWPSSATTTHQQQQQFSTIPSSAAASTAANINLQQQLLQVFNGNESQVAELNRFKIMEIYGDFLLIGARYVYCQVSSCRLLTQGIFSSLPDKLLTQLSPQTWVGDKKTKCEFEWLEVRECICVTIFIELYI